MFRKNVLKPKLLSSPSIAQIARGEARGAAYQNIPSSRTNRSHRWIKHTPKLYRQRPFEWNPYSAGPRGATVPSAYLRCATNIAQLCRVMFTD
jgi:hypothetical protein